MKNNSIYIKKNEVQIFIIINKNFYNGLWKKIWKKKNEIILSLLY